jgi:nucleotide-binding universal stress UspA family protein
MKRIQFRRILCPINFADGSQRTVERASVLARMNDAELRLFHVASEGIRGPGAESLIASLFALTRTLPERTRVSAALAFGDPSWEISQHARVMSADLIVLGTNRHSTPAVIGGTIAADVATHAECPVLHVRPHLLPSPSDTGRGYMDIVCCVDEASGAPTSDAYAHAFARDADARVTVLNVVPADEETSGMMRALAQPVDRTRHTVHVSLTGLPGPEIVAFAQQVRADLIVIGAHDEVARTQRLGSTAAYVMAHAVCPVLITPRVRHLERSAFFASTRAGEIVSHAAESACGIQRPSVRPA